MFKKNIIEKVLLEGSTQISAVLPKRGVNAVENFSFYFPVLMNENIIVDKSVFENFEITFYNQQTFSEDFSSKTATETDNFKSFINTNQDNYLTKFQRNLGNNFYFDKNITTKSYNINFDVDLVENINNQKIFKIALKNSDSKEILNSDFTAFRIFCKKNKRIIYDTDVIKFPTTNFLRDVFENKIIYDFNYFVNFFYLSSFEDSLKLAIPSQSIINQFEKNIIKIKTSNQIDFSITQGSADFILTYNSSNNKEISKTINDLSILDSGVILVDNSLMFEEILKDYNNNNFYFNFTISCTIRFANENLNKNYNKSIILKRSDGIIRKITDIVSSSFYNYYYQQLDFSIEQKLDNEIGNLVLNYKSDSGFAKNALKYFYIYDIKQNNTSIIDSIFIEDKLDVNSYLSVYNKSLLDLFNLELNAFNVYFRNDQTKINSTVTVVIRSLFSESFSREIKSDSLINRQRITNIYTDANIILRDNIVIESEDIENYNITDNSYVQKYESIDINNINKFNNIAYSLGYYNIEGQNSDARGDIISFLTSCVFSIKVEEKISGIRDSKFSIKKYFYGEEILNIDNLENNFVSFNQETINSLNIRLGDIVRSLSNSNKILQETKSILSQSKEERIQNIHFVKTFFEKNNIKFIKKIQISIVPIPKLVKIYQFSGFKDNILFNNESISSEISRNTNLQFINMFYDTNSSLNWDLFLKFKNTYFYSTSIESSNNLIIDKNIINNTSISFANILSPIWDYLTSNLYINKNETFSVTNSINKSQLVNVVDNIENNFNNFSEILTTRHFGNLEEKYINFSNNNGNFLVLDNGLNYLVSNFNLNNIEEPRKIRFVKNNDLNRLDFKFDISLLTLRHNLEDINNSEIFLKYSLHPLILEENNSDLLNTDFMRVSLNDNLNYITQNFNFMRSSLDYFKDFKIPLNKSSMIIEQQGSNLILKVFVDNVTKLIDTQTFKNLFDFCIQNDNLELKNFLIRYSLSFKINDFYYCSNFHSIIQKSNFQNSRTLIVNINNITY